MAFNVNSKKALDQILPECDFTVTARGITVMCERLATPRFIPFDIQGKCKYCHSELMEIDYAISKDDIYIFCPRIRGTKFIEFDIIYDLPQHCIFRVKCKGRVFTIPYNTGEPSKNVEEIEDEPTVEVAVPAPTEGIQQSPNSSISGLSSDAAEVKTDLPSASALDQLFTELF